MVACAEEAFDEAGAYVGAGAKDEDYARWNLGGHYFLDVEDFFSLSLIKVRQRVK